MSDGFIRFVIILCAVPEMFLCVVIGIFTGVQEATNNIKTAWQDPQGTTMGKKFL